MLLSVGNCRRWSGAAVISATVTCVLFLLMHHLTDAEGDSVLAHSQGPLTLDFIRVGRDNWVAANARRLPPEPEVMRKAAPIPDLPEPEYRMPAMHVPQVSGAGLAYSPELPTAGLLSLSHTRNTAPLVRVKPVYPPGALRQSIEGGVKVVFTITEAGGVAEPRIVAAEPRGVFDRAALEAVLKWRYQPQVIDGRAVRRTGFEVVIKFRLQE